MWGLLSCCLQSYKHVPMPCCCHVLPCEATAKNAPGQAGAGWEQSTCLLRLHFLALLHIWLTAAVGCVCVVLTLQYDLRCT